MSVYYSFYAEIFHDGKWQNLCPVIRDVESGKQKIVDVMWGQSALSELVRDLEEHVISRGITDDMSDELRTRFHADFDEECDCLWKEGSTWKDYYEQYVFTVDFDRAVRSRIKRDRPFKYSGYVPKTVAASFEVGETGEIYAWLTKEEYESLPADERMEYQFYEWNNWGEEYGWRWELSQRIEHLIEWFLEGQKKWWNEEYKVRVLVERS